MSFNLDMDMLIEVGIPVSIFIILFLFRKIIVNFIFKILESLFKKTKIKSDDNILMSFKGPARLFFAAIVFYFAYHLVDLEMLGLDILLIEKLNTIVLKIVRTSFVLFLFLGSYNATAATPDLMSEIKELTGLHIKPLLIPFASKIIRFIIILVGVAAVLAEWGFDVNGFVAGLGLFGLAIAMAAKNIFENIFSGSVIITEEPFTYGDWVVAGGVEGVVEDINFRSTIIRKFDKSIVTVPNSSITNDSIQNYSRRDIRRISYELPIKYTSSINNIQKSIEEIKYMLFNHEGIDKETIFVTLDSFGESGYKIFMYFFTNTSNWEKYLLIKEDVNYKIIELLNDNNIEIAMPSRNLYLEEKTNIKGEI